jgi:hypothetical protein
MTGLGRMPFGFCAEGRLTEGLPWRSIVRMSPERQALGDRLMGRGRGRDMDWESAPQEMLDVMFRYADACDGKDWALFDQVFTPDAIATYRTLRYDSREAIVALIRSRLSPCGATQHLMGNHTFEHSGASWRTRCKFRAWHQGPEGRRHVTYEVFGYYTDIWSRTPDGWRIADRTLSVGGEVGDGSVLGPVAGGH